MDIVTRQCQLSDVIIRQIVIRHTQELFDAVVGAISSDHPADADAADSSDEAEAMMTTTATTDSIHTNL